MTVHLLACMLAARLLLLPGDLAMAGEAEGGFASDPVEAGRQSLRAQRDMPWYDPEADTVRRIDVVPSEDDERRHSSWASEEPPPRSPATPGGGVLGQLLQILAWVLLAAILILIVWLLVWAALRLEASSHTGTSAKIDEQEVDASRMEGLPIPAADARQDLLAMARSCLEAGDLGRAIVYAFAYQLVELDKCQFIHLSKGKTNRQYLRELNAWPQLAALVRLTMLAFEDVFFGRHAISRQRFQSCWDSLDDFHRHLEQARP